MPARRKPSSDALPAAKKSALAKASTAIGASPALVTDLRQLILSAREQVARAVDSALGPSATASARTSSRTSGRNTGKRFSTH